MAKIIGAAANANATGIAAAFPQLCEMLAKKKLLSAGDIELLRHAALLGFDRAGETLPLAKEETEDLERVRLYVDRLWQDAAVAAEGQD
jgi:hypothetical protein